MKLTDKELKKLNQEMDNLLSKIDFNAIIKEVTENEWGKNKRKHRGTLQNLKGS